MPIERKNDIISSGESMIIDIEGTDGSGKATQTKLLYDFLTASGYKCRLISFPNYDSPSSSLVKMYLNGDFSDRMDSYQISTIFAVDRLFTMNEIDCSEYDFVLFDRYVPSNMIHQSTKIKDQNELNDFLNWVQDFEYDKLKLPRPDKIIFLDMPTEFSIELARNRASLKNGMKKDILESDDSHMILAYERAKYVAKKYGWIHVNCVDLNIKSEQAIHHDILKKLGLDKLISK